jgi:hypothetical protein
MWREGNIPSSANCGKKKQQRLSLYRLFFFLLLLKSHFWGEATCLALGLG